MEKVLKVLVECSACGNSEEIDALTIARDPYWYQIADVFTGECPKCKNLSYYIQAIHEGGKKFTLTLEELDVNSVAREMVGRSLTVDEMNDVFERIGKCFDWGGQVSDIIGYVCGERVID